MYSIDLEASHGASGGDPTVKATLYPDGKKTNIRNSVVYEESSGRIFFCTDTGIHAVNFDAEKGTFGEMRTVEGVAAYGGSTVSVYNHRLYATADGITVVDTNTLEKIYSTGPCVAEVEGQETQISPSGRLTISIGYATSKNDNTVYIYGNSNSSPNHQVVLRDSETAVSGTLEYLNTAAVNPNWSTSQIYVANDGSLVFVNDGATLYCLRSNPDLSALLQEAKEEKTAAIQGVTRGLKQDDYTAESWNKLQTAISAALKALEEADTLEAVEAVEVPSTGILVKKAADNTTSSNTAPDDGREETAKPPKTGDSRPAALWFAVALSSLTVLAALGIGKKRQNH